MQQKNVLNQHSTSRERERAREESDESNGNENVTGRFCFIGAFVFTMAEQR